MKTRSRAKGEPTFSFRAADRYNKERDNKTVDLMLTNIYLIIIIINTFTIRCYFLPLFSMTCDTSIIFYFAYPKSAMPSK